MNIEYNIKIKHADECVKIKIDKRETPKDCSALMNGFKCLLKNYRNYLSDEEISKIIAMVLRLEDHDNRLSISQQKIMFKNREKIEKRIAKILKVPLSEIRK